MAIREIGVALLGVGTIGGAVARAILEEGDAIAARRGVRLVIRRALARSRERVVAAGLPWDVAAAEIDEVLRDQRVEVVVEALGGEEPAASYLHRSLEAGKHVVTANKEALAKRFGELADAARARGRALLFEASVGGGIPLMASLRQILAVNRITRIRGIVNGTTNYILTQMTEQGTTYADALRQAQQLGYAEPDPRADVEGDDAAYKLAILASLAAGRHIRPEQVERTGITGVTPEELREARSRGGAIKLIASAESDGGVWRLRVAPEFVSGEHLLSHVRLNFNAVEITGDRIGTVLLYGQGAGPLPTASAILSDVVDAVCFGVALTPSLSTA
jgi:homoserine dehydrogenase